ncbi:MAG: hypothetical protein J7J31_02505 [Helicobacteraceae bacterium]|nr:hypothetical protein [Helicobacteraceae bacterium]
MNTENKKQTLLSEPLSQDAMRLARALYNTYKENDDGDLDMYIKIEAILRLLKLEDTQESLLYIRKLLEELNEPLGVKDFNFDGKIYPLHFVIFCKYSFDERTLHIQLSQEYLDVQQNYMQDAFL